MLYESDVPKCVCAWGKNVWKVNTKLLTVSNLGEEKQEVNAMKICSFYLDVFTVLFFSNKDLLFLLK